MTSKQTTNFPASIYARLKNLSKELNENLNALITRYTNERLLYRLSKEADADHFLLKGATRLFLNGGPSHRPTKDIDLAGFGEISLENMKTLFQKLCDIHIENEGLVFDSASVKTEDIRDDNAYHGIRVKLLAALGKIPIHLQVDVGFGDAIDPPAKMQDIHTLLDHPAPRMKVYPLEVVVAEKTQIIVELGTINSRLKDYFDLCYLARVKTFDGAILTSAFKATFERRKTIIPTALPIGLTEEYMTDARKIQWKKLRSRISQEAPDTLEETITHIVDFVWPLIENMHSGNNFDKHWNAGGPWKPK